MNKVFVSFHSYLEKKRFDFSKKLPEIPRMWEGSTLEVIYGNFSVQFDGPDYKFGQ